MSIESLISKLADDGVKSKESAWQKYVLVITAEDTPDGAEKTVANAIKTIGLTTDQIRAHAKVVGEVREADRRSKDVTALQETANLLMLDRSAADEKLKVETAKLQENCRQVRIKLMSAQDAVSAARQVVELGDRHRTHFPYLFDVDAPCPYLPGGQQQLADRLAGLEKELRTAIDTRDDSRRAQIEREISTVNGVIRNASRLN